MTIGTDYNGGNYWNGKNGIIRAYNTDLSVNQIKHNWHCDGSKFADMNQEYNNGSIRRT